MRNCFSLAPEAKSRRDEDELMGLAKDKKDFYGESRFVFIQRTQ
jgi:hypothetical protein